MWEPMARSPNRSPTEQITITVPAQTFAYLVRLATAGAIGANEALVASHLVVSEVERLMLERRAETALAPIAISDE